MEIEEIQIIIRLMNNAMMEIPIMETDAVVLELSRLDIVELEFLARDRPDLDAEMDLLVDLKFETMETQ